MKIREKTAVLLSAVIIAGNAAAQMPAAQADLTASSQAAYQMAAVIDRARGNAIMSGDYDKAIEALTGSGRKRFASRTNLCVAYTLNGELAKADTECDAALRLSEGHAERASDLTRKAARRDVAVALSNLGVVKAVSGDLSGARDDFARAVELSPGMDQASSNLQRLIDAQDTGA